MKRTKWSLSAALIVILIVSCAVPLALAAGRRKGNDRILSRITFIHYRRGYAKPPWAGGGDKGAKEDQGYYDYIARGAKWKAMENFFVNPANLSGLDENFVADTVSDGMTEWETASGTADLTIFGLLFINYQADYNNGDLDDFNTISFGGGSDPNIIAVTTVWGYFSGPPNSREIIEADILFNEAYFAFGNADLDSTVMDLLSIATHEIGHCTGMDDLYLADASLETMYGYSEYGETIKRDLYTGDITGITKLYK